VNTYIGIDCIALPTGISGAANYIYNLARSLLSAERDFPLAILCKPIHEPAFKKFLKPGDKCITVPLKNRPHQLVFYEYMLSDLLLRENIKLFHATHYITPPRHEGYKMITTFHDMGFILHPEYYPLIKRLYFGHRMSTFISRSDIVMAVSEATSDSIAEIFPKSYSKLRVIYPGVNHFNGNGTAIKNKKYLLTVNSFEKRKNIPFLIKVFNLLKSKYNLEHQYVVVGNQTNDYAAVLAEYNRSRFKNDIALLHSISDKELTTLYQNADLYLNASTFEGFGFTAFEAIKFSCPSIMYHSNVLKKVFVDHPYLLNNLDIQQWTDLIARELTLQFPQKIDPSMIEHFTWEKSVEKTINLYSQLLTSREVPVG
jgi:glycosyltransferase involved in cell wall biosynthesis